MKARPVRDDQQTKQFACSIPYDCSRRYISETGRLSEIAYALSSTNAI